ncbi:META domain-containing protein [Malikia sp.]|uniref:META domain-containing protein n=1 Tax=Malikia sp. TaxID=2070706 RepID=UPI0026208CA8|nr:META domain-containing protein [Malikia sp.]MDD2729524.1 META domain-containing protein [Malikia sp.]
MTLPSAPARWLGILAFCFLSDVGAQTLPPDPGLETFTETPGRLAASPRRFEQVWDVVELMGQPMLSDSQRPARVVLRPQGGLMVDGGCNYFSGRVERDAQGLFRVSKYGGTHAGCEKPPRSEALLNSALMMVDGYRWDRGLVLRSGGNDLVRLQPSAHQTSQDIEQALASRSVPAPAATQPAQPARAVASGAAEKNCRPVKVAKSKKAGAKGSKAARAAKAKASKTVCKPVAGVGKHKTLKSTGKTRLTGKSKASKAGKAKAVSRTKAASRAKAKAAARHGKHKR